MNSQGDRSSFLVDAQVLAAEIATDRPPIVVDARWTLNGPPGIVSYRAGHLPSARFADLETELSGRRGAAGRHPLPASADFERLMRRLGVSDGSSVVVYDASDSVPASRAWWDLRYFGHHDVRVLDGGYPAWVQAGLPVTTEEPGIVPGSFVALPGGMPVIGASEAATIAEKGVLIDVRVGERFRGEVEPVDPIAGRIPGAVNLPSGGNVSSDGRFLDGSALRRRYEPLGIPGDAAVGIYCGSGVNAANGVLAMALAGLPTPALFVGSWSHWITDPSRPIATGPA